MSEEIQLANTITALYERQAELIAELHVVELERNAAQAREKIARDAYEGQQQAYRELEALYAAMTERAQRAEAKWNTEIVRAAQAGLDSYALYEAIQEAIDCGCRGVHWVDIEGEAETEACDLWITLDDKLQAYKNGEHPGARLLERIRRAAEHLPGRPDMAEQILSDILG